MLPHVLSTASCLALTQGGCREEPELTDDSEAT